MDSISAEASSIENRHNWRPCRFDPPSLILEIQHLNLGLQHHLYIVFSFQQHATK
jgi:hypothetical protein